MTQYNYWYGGVTNNHGVCLGGWGKLFLLHVYEHLCKQTHDASGIHLSQQ